MGQEDGIKLDSSIGYSAGSYGVFKYVNIYVTLVVNSMVEDDILYHVVKLFLWIPDF